MEDWIEYKNIPLRKEEPAENQQTMAKNNMAALARDNSLSAYRHRHCLEKKQDEGNFIPCHTSLRARFLFP